MQSIYYKFIDINFFCDSLKGTTSECSSAKGQNMHYSGMLRIYDDCEYQILKIIGK